MASSTPKTILSIPFPLPTTTPISLTTPSTGHFRLIDVPSFAEGTSLRVFEYHSPDSSSYTTPLPPYAAISYVWRGLPAPSSSPLITIAGTNSSSRISIPVLRTVCQALQALGCDLVWLDALCIHQADDDDKAWQMQRMHAVYASCELCLVVPGGLQRLAGLEEETTWIHRAWTLQEALAPGEVKVLFGWTRGDAWLQTTRSTEVRQVVESVAAVADMKDLLETAMKSDCTVIQPNHPDTPLSVNIAGPPSAVRILLGALDLVDQPGFSRAVWRCSFARTAKYAPDNVFAIMGVLGVTLDTAKFPGHDNAERVRATKALMRALLDKEGGRAEWLGMAPGMENCKELTTVPVFPEVGGDGRAVVRRDGGEVEAAGLADEWWTVVDGPGGVVDDDGYLELRARAASVKRAHGSELTRLAAACPWKIVPRGEETSLFAVSIGTKQPYMNGSAPMIVEENDGVLMVLEEHSPGRWHIVEYAFVPRSVPDGEAWAEESFKVGGRG